MKPFLFTYSPTCPSWIVQGALNDTNAVETWVQPLPQAVIVVSRLAARDLASVFRGRLGETWFVLTEVNSQTVDGFLPGNLWHFIRDAETGSVPALLPASVGGG